ncbi:hypothetical protein LNV23_07420 [Paucibacter sp. DJ1R-11]|uniref:hypothetical protein n=1 Tax=Paucibacter sp. DJ1R-11 TaxID=2893556 RepID=UPI0021E36FC4|nr:hypothetical protein [Paucibacter sp. DJ1R-11]MCV2363279.1 hypothetical protein [Paucibacter sp. DJ1R-11]
MARYEHLPLYKAALDMTAHFEQLVAGFSLHHKYTLGTEWREGTRAVPWQAFCERPVESAADCGDSQSASEYPQWAPCCPWRSNADGLLLAEPVIEAGAHPWLAQQLGRAT